MRLMETWCKCRTKKTNTCERSSNICDRIKNCKQKSFGSKEPKSRFIPRIVECVNGVEKVHRIFLTFSPFYLYSIWIFFFFFFFRIVNLLVSASVATNPDIVVVKMPQQKEVRGLMHMLGLL